MDIVAGAVVTASVELLLNKLVSCQQLRFAGPDLKKWHGKLSNICTVLEDAEEKQITDDSVKKWLVDLQNLAYDMEDILDEFETEALERKLSGGSEASTSKARMLIPTCCTNVNPRSLIFNVKMGSRIKEITKRLDDMVAAKNELHVLGIPKERSNKVKGSDQRLPTTCLPETHVYGREEDQEAIVKLLLKDEAYEDGISVVPIVGLGGVGKTTLAQNVYNDARVESHFDIRAWVCVSDNFDVIRITKAIWDVVRDVVRDHSDYDSDLNMLQVKLEEKLRKKKSFIVLDDIWNDDYNMWTSLLRPFRACSSGSKILITTRSNEISSRFGTVPTHQLKELPFNDCVSIFAHHSLGRNNFDEHQNLKEIGEKIVSKCNGLPLAVKTLGGLLRNNIKRGYWEQVLYSNIWDLAKNADDIMPALRLSYHYLSPELKRCFAYCSLLPKDYEFLKDEIILLWMAQGFLIKTNSPKQMEDLGDEYFQELQSRSFFQQSSNNTPRYVMHDLINDLAQWVAGTFFFFKMENTIESDKQNGISKNHRHLSYVCGVLDGIKRFKGFNEFKHLRTFLPLHPSRTTGGWVSSEIFNILSKLCHLRVLSLNGYCNIDELPSAIGDLKYLRHIDLSNTVISCLPESINSLCNLLTLKLEGCRNLRKLCDVGKLINLRYLNTNETWLQQMPSNMGQLTSLRILSDFVVGRNAGSGLKALKLLKHLQGTLRIRGLENIRDVVDAKEADLSGKSNIRELVLKWRKTDDFGNLEMERLVLDMLRPNPKLEQLTINSYGGISLPPWLENTIFSNLVFLRIQDCRNCTSLPSVGQLPSLKTLDILSMNGIKRVGLEFYGNGCSRPFPSLETLRFGIMQEWEEWISYGNGQEVEGFPHLQQLSIFDCPNLQGRLPERFPSLKSLDISYCRKLLVSIASFPEGCRFEIYGCKQVHPRTETDLGTLCPIIFSDVHRGWVSLTKRFKQSLSEVEEVESVQYHAPTSISYSGIVSTQDARFRWQYGWQYGMYKRIAEENVEELQLRGLPYICHYLEFDNVCLRTLPQVLLNLGFLRWIRISHCSDLVSFPEASLPSQLRGIDIENCDLLECLPDSWMESTSLERLNVRHCESLVHLARNQLSPNLKELVICECIDLKTLIQEENKSLQSSIIGIAECLSTKSSFSKCEFPATLSYIEIWSCHKLEALPHNMHQLNHLRDLTISSCSSLVSFPAGGLPSTNLTNLQITNCCKLEELPNNMHQLEHLQEIEVRHCPSLVTFPPGGLPSTNLKTLTIGACEKLKALPNGMHKLHRLPKIRISFCSSLVSFPEEGLPSTNLTELTIDNCEKLEALPNGMHQLHHLRKIGISYCPSLVSFPEEGLPSTNLIELTIDNCEKLEALPNGMHQLHHLRKIEISCCPSLVSFPEEGLPSTNLTELTIKGCEKLEALPNDMHQLNHLQKIAIWMCSSLVSFPEGGLPSINLTELAIGHCEKLNGLPKCMHNLSSLRRVRINNCQAMESLPENGFPINLESLSISDTPKICQPLFQWGLHKLSSLEELYIRGCPDVVSFPPEETGIMLPTSLTILHIARFTELECLSSVIQSLNSLTALYIVACPKLKSFPKKGLPLSLLRLHISDCPLLEQNCKKDGGRYWPMIAYIPRIDLRIDHIIVEEEEEEDNFIILQDTKETNNFH